MTATLNAHFELLLAQRMRQEASEVADRGGVIAEQLHLAKASTITNNAENALRLDESNRIDTFGAETLSKGAESAILAKRLRSPDKVTVNASVDRLNLIHNADVFDLALDTAESIGATNAIEKMIAHELAAAHKTAMDLLERCKEQGDPTREIKSINAAARLMAVVQQGALAIQRLKGGGNHVMTIKHVTVEPGGQAVIGNVQGGRTNTGDQGAPE